MRIWFHKLINYEYWSSWVLYSLIFPYIAYLGLRTRSSTFYTNVNEFPPDGGLIHYSKYEILRRIPENYLPKTILVTEKDLQDFNYSSEFTLPFIAKPDKGERGKGVKKINTHEDWLTYISSAKGDIIVQSIIDLPLECGIFYVKLPNSNTGLITSITTKEFLSVKGDGYSNINELMSRDLRALMQVDRFDKSFLQSIPKKDEVIILEPIGNHNRGTRFINSMNLLNQDLLKTIESLSNQIDGFNYGRFDIKYNTFEELSQGKNFKIIELNGINSEPTHIYDQSNGLYKSLKDMCFHWNLMAQISIQNHKKGIKRMTLKNFLIHLFRI